MPHLFLGQSSAVTALVNPEFVAANVDALLAHKESVPQPDSHQNWFDINHLALEKLYLVMRTVLYAWFLARPRRGVA